MVSTVELNITKGTVSTLISLLVIHTVLVIHTEQGVFYTDNIIKTIPSYSIVPILTELCI